MTQIAARPDYQIMRAQLNDTTSGGAAEPRLGEKRTA